MVKYLKFCTFFDNSFAIMMLRILLWLHFSQPMWYQFNYRIKYLKMFYVLLWMSWGERVRIQTAHSLAALFLLQIAIFPLYLLELCLRIYENDPQKRIKLTGLRNRGSPLNTYFRFLNIQDNWPNGARCQNSPCGEEERGWNGPKTEK